MPAREARFFADCMVGKLAKWLRILGYDTAYQRKIADRDLVLRAQFEERIILTRDGGLLSRRGVNEYLLVQSSDYLDQLREVVTAFRLGREDLEKKWESIVESIGDRGAQHPARILSQQLGQIDPAIAATHA